MARTSPYRWASPGDLNAFFGLSIDNLAVLVLTVSLLATVFGYPAQFALSHLVPGTAVGVVVGDLIFTWMAFRLASRTGRSDITAMPLGLDTPSTFGMVFFVIGPAFAEAVAGGMDQEAAARRAWHIGMCSIVASGVFKMACAFVAGPVRRLVPRAALLGSLTAIALALITFLPLLEIFASPLAGLVALGIILASLTAHVPFPFKIPGALAALVVGGLIQFLGQRAGWIPDGSHMAIDPAAALWPTEWLAAFRCEWLEAWPYTVKYLPIVIPFALATVVGGIDCTESAAAAGDEYDTGKVIGVEAIATIVAGACGGVIQTTPYIGHPAYKAPSPTSIRSCPAPPWCRSWCSWAWRSRHRAFMPRPSGTIRRSRSPACRRSRPWPRSRPTRCWPQAPGPMPCSPASSSRCGSSRPASSSPACSGPACSRPCSIAGSPAPPAGAWPRPRARSAASSIRRSRMAGCFYPGPSASFPPRRPAAGR